MFKRFFYASAAVLMLALAYHFGASTATAQAPANSVVAATDTWVYTANGDAYVTVSTAGQWQFVGNLFTGPVSTQQGSWGSIKARYR